MATVPLSGTNIRLLSGVPFSNDYKNTRWFDNITDQTNYFLARNIIHQESQHNFQRIEGSPYISVNKSIDDLWSTNYLMFQNAQYNNKWFYGFVTNLEYVNARHTRVHFQIDVLQTWLFDMDFKPSYVLREHRPLWNSDGTPVVNTLDEGLDYGTEYEIVSVENYVPFDDLFFLVIISKSIMHTGEGVEPNKIKSSLNGMPQPLSYYIHPFRQNGTVPDVAGMQELSSVTDLLTNIFSQDDAVNNMVGMYVTDYIGLNPSYDGTTLDFGAAGVTFAGITDDTNGNVNTIYLESLPQYFDKDYAFGEKYSDYYDVSESKLLMYPYTVLTLTDFRGNQADFKNEYINNPNIELTVKGSMGTSNKVAYVVKDYNTSLLENASDKEIVNIGNALISNSVNDVAIINDYLSAYLQGNRNSIQNQQNSIMFNGVMDTIGGVVGGVAGGMSGSVMGAVSGGMGAISGAGNTALNLQAINAKQKDIANTPPSLGKMGSNTAFDYGNDFRGMFIVKKQIKEEYRKKLSDFFRMFGYKTNEIKIPNFHTRRVWNYVQTESCNITGNFNNEDLQELKSIFDNGITVWHTNDVGNYNPENGVI